ncbi:hypothetical protein AB835_03715 [Candidatus Endobugula sertula]|uniref:HTH cro/C1-type domain-containing protein n=1 Tax=Candidatus Endobugula sertula TaxID=62101 RepID=A0A1D2QSA3_9GAMM|nr:hypothetical protein AB835_03715 [Candidatus Endobugula sertula]
MSDEIAARLQQIRKMYGLSQRELAKRAGVTNSSVSMIEQGRVSPSISSLEKLLKGIPMNIRDFFNIDFDDHFTCFFRSYQMFCFSNQKIDYYCLSDSKVGRGQLSYEVHNPGSDTGETMCVDERSFSGFVVQGQLEAIIDCQFATLDAGDAFIVESNHPYRFRNTCTKKSILVINRSIH